VPVEPEQIANDALEAAEAGAAIAHIHVRNPKNGKPSRDIELYRQVVELIRASNADLIINLTGGLGGDLAFGDFDTIELIPPTDFVGPDARVAHIMGLVPEIGSLDCGSLNFGELVYVTTPNILRRICRLYSKFGVLPELEVFELGHIEIAKMLIDEGLIDQPPLFQICLGVKHGAQATPEAMIAMRNALPVNANWAGFGVGKGQMPMVAQAYLLGGHIRVGLEDNLYLSRGVLATNGQLVECAAGIVKSLGGQIMEPREAREYLGLSLA